MGITGDRYRGDCAGHTIEFVLDNWVKTAALYIDGKRVGFAWRILPHDITLTATLEAGGVQHTIVAKSINHFPTTIETVEVDGAALPMTRTK